jgi:predicted AAA+ superfamily ATPase
MIERGIHAAVSNAISTSKLVLLEGPKGAGKQTLISQIIEEQNKSCSIIDASQKEVRKSIEENASQLTSNEHSILIIRQAQFLSNLQEILEMTLTDAIHSTVIVTCSYPPIMDPELREVLELEGMLFSLYAPSFSEAAQHFGLTHEIELMEERLIFGNYPKVLSDLDNASTHLSEMIQEVIQTQLGANDRVNKSDKLMKMLKILAFQCGEPISYNDIAQRCGVDNETIERYIELFEKAFLLIRLPSYHNGHRYELKKTHCVYFQDNGIRNALIQNFHEPDMRNDLDALWRNYMVSERIKWIRSHKMNKQVYFWRTHTRQQLDFVEIGVDTIMGYKADPSIFSYAKRQKVKIPKSFAECYPKAKTSVLNKSTYWNFLTRKV